MSKSAGDSKSASAFNFGAAAKQQPRASTVTGSAAAAAAAAGATGSGAASSVAASDVKPAKAARPYIRVKVLSMGEGCVGKSCLIKRYCEEKFVSDYISTIGVDFGVRTVTVDSREVKVNFWDLSGHPEFVDVRTEFYRDTEGVLLVFDVTSRKSFTALESWLKESAKHACNPYVTFCVANKADLTKQRVVSEAEARQWANAKNFVYWESSARSGLNVNEMFNSLFKAIVKDAPKI